MVRNYFDLIVWKESRELVVMIYKLIESVPKFEMYSLADQMRRAAVSIPSNIAEGKNRNSTKEFKHFLSVARGSVAELETQLLICIDLKYLNEEQITETFEKCGAIDRMLTSLMSKLN